MRFSFSLFGEEFSVNATVIKQLNRFHHRKCSEEELFAVRTRLILWGLINSDGLLTPAGRVVEENGAAMLALVDNCNKSAVKIQRAKEMAESTAK